MCWEKLEFCRKVKKVLVIFNLSGLTTVRYSLVVGYFFSCELEFVSESKDVG